MIKLLYKLGPGLLYAGAAVGVSHLVQSTKAGGYYGFQLLIFVVLANILKYPFFEFSPRYTIVKNESVIEGYKKLGNWAIWLFLGLTILTMFTIQAAVTIVTASLTKNIFNLQSLDISVISTGIILICGIIIFIGRYKTLDLLMKFIIILLSLSTILAVLFALNNTTYFNSEFVYPFQFEGHHLSFLIALIGWMPAPIDISIWQSIWNLEKQKTQHIDLKTSLLDFNIGYWSTLILAILFLSLGALSFYGSDQEFSNKGTLFVNQVLEMYTSQIGQWSYPIIAIAALTTMFSTTLTCFDAFPRTLSPTLQILQNKKVKPPNHVQKILWLSIVGIGAIIIITFLIENMTAMIKIATIGSFLTAPILAFLNYKLIYNKDFPIHSRPKLFVKYLAWIGLLGLVGLSIWFLIT